MPRLRKAAWRARSTVDWNGCPAGLVQDLERFKARARGARVRQLALLGLLAEQRGYRANADGSDLLYPPQTAPGPAPLPGPTAAPLPAPEPSVPKISEGLSRLASAFGTDAFG